MSYRYRVITVFGGSGFIGRHLIRRLARTGAVIRVPTRNPGRAGFLRTNGNVGQIVPMATNVMNDASLEQAIRGADTVINLVGILHEGRNARFSTIQAELPGRIARTARAAGVRRLVQMSALGADPTSASEYARTKAAGEQAALAAFSGATVFRPSVVFGPEDQFFNRFAAMARLSPALPLIGGGVTRMQPVYVGDVAEAITRAVEDGATEGRYFELGGPRVYSFRELMELLLNDVGRRRFLVPVPWRAAEIMGSLLGRLPNPPLTRDQVELLKVDNAVSGRHPGLEDLGVAPTAVEVILPTYLDRFRVGGRLGPRRTTA